ncbi:CLUMA_CG021581, isoform A [Clunio marinus]|uniref:CLUMA_CG021581, isoform A n=1 Tax=Clunio marinus TaxID=568069 RepID=A0A1J1JAT2_9DIPT|nr:CLUMA_CG021581, isoform A [Clunio marinus]
MLPYHGAFWNLVVVTDSVSSIEEIGTTKDLHGNFFFSIFSSACLSCSLFKEDEKETKKKKRVLMNKRELSEELLFIIKRFNFHECFITLHFQEYPQSIVAECPLIYMLKVPLNLLLHCFNNNEELVIENEDILTD